MSIQVLTPQLANQIAAGEVVERPASVVKELVENSLDAGATRIDIDIDRGGSKVIRIRDDGCGIAKDDLALALARHATSKIASLDDLEAITSLGFRGEALASISSVSRLILTSCTASQSEAWQVYAEGREMAVTIKPAAHPRGTTLEVLDLFYNTPARRKFMRTEKTEFSHIDEIIRRIALGRFDVSLTLVHNGKIIRQYRSAIERDQQQRRLAAICGSVFMQHALAIQWQHGDLSLHGWVVDVTGSRQLTDIQYCYVNGRIMRDRLINHAIRQAYQDQLGNDHHPAYVLYLQLDPQQVDVNVHPAKHEVRFHQSRLVHDFIYQGVLRALQQSKSVTKNTLASATISPAEYKQPANRLASGGNQFAAPHSLSETANTAEYKPRPRQLYRPEEGMIYQQLMKASEPVLISDPAHVHVNETVAYGRVALKHQATPVSHAKSFGRLLTVICERYALIESQHTLALLALSQGERRLKQAQLIPVHHGLKSQPLLIPLRLKVSRPEREAANQFADLLTRTGIDVKLDGQSVVLQGVPLPIRQQNLQILIPELLVYLSNQQEVTVECLTRWLACRITLERDSWNDAQAIALLTDLERLCPELVISPPAELVCAVDISTALDALKHGVG